MASLIKKIEVGDPPMKVEWWLPERPRDGYPVVLGLPMLKEVPVPVIDGQFPMRYLNRSFAAQGFHAAFIDYALPLNPRDPDVLARASAGLKSLLVCAKQLIDFFERKLKSDGFFLYGISLGGILGATFSAQESRIKKSLLLLGGADIPGILGETHGLGAEELTAIRKQYGGDPQQFRRMVENLFRDVDPIHFASSLDPRRVCLINVEGDTVVPNAYSELLYRTIVAGKKEAFRRELLPLPFVPRGLRHVAGLVYLPYAKKVALEFFNSAL